MLNILGAVGDPELSNNINKLQAESFTLNNIFTYTNSWQIIEQALSPMWTIMLTSQTTHTCRAALQLALVKNKAVLIIPNIILTKEL